MPPNGTLNFRTALAAALIVAALPRADAQTNIPAAAPLRPTLWAVKLDRPGLPNCYQVATNFYRGAQPSHKGMAQLKSMGIKRVLDLRILHTDGVLLSGIDIKTARLPMVPWHPTRVEVVRFLKIITDTNNLPLFVHCQHGADRTGFLCAIYRVAVCGWTKQEAIREMKSGGFGFNPGWKSIVRFIESADIPKIREEAGMARDLATSPAREPGAPPSKT